MRAKTVRWSQAARSTRVSILSRSARKSIGLVSRSSAPRSSALRFVSASAIGRNHDHGMSGLPARTR